MTGYEIAFNEKGQRAQIVTVYGTSREFTNLIKKKKYQVKVRGFVVLNKVKYYGAWSTRKTITAK